MVNVFLGFAIISVLSAGLAGMGSKAFVSQFFTGIFLLTIVLAEYVLARLRERGDRSRTKQLAETSRREPAAPVPG
jgi:ribose transport system permease protein